MTGASVACAVLAHVVPVAASSPEPTKPTAAVVAEMTERVSAADQAYAAGHLLAAESRARRALVMAYTLLGQLEIARSNPRAAEEALARAAVRAPRFAIDARALVHGLRASRGELDPALGELRLLTQMFPGHLEARRQLVSALIHADNLDEAALELEALRGVDPEGADALETRVRNGKSPSSLPGEIPHPAAPSPAAALPFVDEPESLEQSVVAVIDRSEALLASALAASRQGHDPSPAGSPAADLALARGALASGEIKKALEHTRRALDAAPSSEALLHFYASVALDAGMTSIAAPVVETLARMEPESADYAVLVGRVWRGLGKTKEASDELLRAVELDPGLPAARRELGLALGVESRFEASKKHLEHFLQSLEEPWQELDVQAALAEAEERLGDAPAAESRARRVLQKAPGHARARLVLGLVLAGRGEFAAARSELEEAIDADPSLARAHYRLSFACTRLGDRECASRHLALYRRALSGKEGELVPMTSVIRSDEANPSPMDPSSEVQDSQGSGD